MKILAIFQNQEIEVMKNLHIDDTINRLKLIEVRNTIVKGSHIILFLEHLRFMGQCMIDLKKLSQPVFTCDLCKEFNSDWSADDSVYANVIEVNTRHHGIFKSLYLNWEIHKAEIIQLGISYSINPYEFMIKFLERGGLIRIDSGGGQVNIGQSYDIGIRLRYIKETFGVLKMPIFSNLNDENLDKADLEYIKNPNLFKEKTINLYCRIWDDAKKLK